MSSMSSTFTPFAGYPSMPAPVLQTAGEQPAAAATSPAGSWPSMLNPGNPLFWFGVLAATTLGLMAVSGNVRLGRTKVSAAIGGS